MLEFYRLKRASVSSYAADLYGFLMCAYAAKGNPAARISDAVIIERLDMSRRRLKAAREELEDADAIFTTRTPNGHVYEITGASMRSGGEPLNGKEFRLEGELVGEKRPRHPKTGKVPVYCARDIDEIYDLFPRKIAPAATKKAIRNVITKRRIPVEYLKERVSLYAQKVGTWTEDEKRYIASPCKWFTEGRYDDDPSEWESKQIGVRKMKGDNFKTTPTDTGGFDSL